MPIIALTTDYGTRDGYVGAVKGVIAGLAPRATIVDVSHDVPPQDVQHGAFVLWQVLPHFPPETIHAVVVDPGVGTPRRILAARCHDQVILAPDNGLLSFVLDDWPPRELREVTEESFMRPCRSATFHGRDILAPVAAHVANGVPLGKLGNVVDAWQRLAVRLRAEPMEHGLRGKVVHADRFGNLVTNVRRDQLAASGLEAGRVVVCVQGQAVGPLRSTFSDVPMGEVVAYPGSSELLEIAVNGGVAAARFSSWWELHVEVRRF